MANFRVIENLKDHLKKVKAQRDSTERVGFNMGSFLERDPIAPDMSLPQRVRERENNMLCHTSACLAGHAVIMEQGIGVIEQYPRINFDFEGSMVLGLSPAESNHMFYGGWAKDEDGVNRMEEASIDDAIRYLEEVLAERDVLITVPITGMVEVRR